MLFASLFGYRLVHYWGYSSKPLWFFETLVFAALALAYVFRIPAQVPAQGWLEHILPYVCSAIPFAMLFSPWNPGPWKGTSLTLMISGLTITMAGIGSLGRSFGITVAVRHMVQHGLYRWIRHPIYLGEIVNTFGVATLRFSPLSAAILLAFITLQTLRARLEERKLLAVCPEEYAAYMKRTGMFVPRLL